MNQLAPIENRNVLTSLSRKYGMEPAEFQETVLATCSPKGRNAQRLTKPEFYMLLMAAEKYSLNPLMKEIYAFPAKGGGIQIIVGVDGWMNLINSHQNFDGMHFEDHREGGKVIAITCRMYRKDRNHPIEVTEYMSECRRGTDVWSQWPIRMLRHKAAIQAARYAFGFSNIMEPDEAERAIAPALKADLRDDLEARRKTVVSDEGFDQDRIENDLSQAQSADPDIIDAEIGPETTEQQEGSETASVEQEDSVANLTEGQIELLGEIEEAFQGCRTIADLKGEASKFEEDINEGGEVFVNLCRKAFANRRAELGAK